MFKHYQMYDQIQSILLKDFEFTTHSYFNKCLHNDQTWSTMIKRDQTCSNVIKHAQTWSNMLKHAQNENMSHSSNLHKFPHIWANVYIMIKHQWWCRSWRWQLCDCLCHFQWPWSCIGHPLHFPNRKKIWDDQSHNLDIFPPGRSGFGGCSRGYPPWTCSGRRQVGGDRSRWWP